MERIKTTYTYRDGTRTVVEDIMVENAENIESINVVYEKIPSYALELSEDELAAVYAVLARVSGGETSIRKFTFNVLRAIERLNVNHGKFNNCIEDNYRMRALPNYKEFLNNPDAS